MTIGASYTAAGAQVVHTLTKREIEEARNEVEPVHIVQPQAARGGWGE